MTTILAIDTATAACSAAVRRAGRLAASRTEVIGRGHAEALMPMVEAVMAEAKLDYAALDAIAVTVGPGAFTGLRIGLAAARGLALAAGKPAIGITTLEAVAASVPAKRRNDRTVLVALETKRDDFYVQAFAPSLTPLSEPAALDPAALAAWLPGGPLLIAGDAAARAADAIEEATGGDRAIELAGELLYPDPAIVAELAEARLTALAAAGTPPPDPRPLYLKPPAVTVPADGGRLRP